MMSARVPAANSAKALLVFQCSQQPRLRSFSNDSLDLLRALLARCRVSTTGQERRVEALFLPEPEIDLLGNCESVIDFDPEIANRAFKLGMTERKLNSPDVASLLVDLRSLSSPHRMSTIALRIKSDASYPPVDDPAVLTG